MVKGIWDLLRRIWYLELGIWSLDLPKYACLNYEL